VTLRHFYSPVFRKCFVEAQGILLGLTHAKVRHTLRIYERNYIEG
jgi:hypothetical protein